MATTYTITLDGHTFDRDELPFRGPLEEFPDQVWSEQNVLGAADPGTILTFMGTRSQKWPFTSVCDSTAKDKLVALHTARLPVTLKTPQNPTTGFSVLVRVNRIEHKVPAHDGKFLVEFTMTAR